MIDTLHLLPPVEIPPCPPFDKGGSGEICICRDLQRPTSPICERLNNIRQGGFTLVGTVFIITILAALGVFLVTIADTQQATSLLSLQGARAYAATQSGIEWAVRQAAVPPHSCALSTTITPALGAPGNFTITVTCVASAVTEGAITYNVYNITSTATAGSASTGDLVTREVRASVTDD